MQLPIRQEQGSSQMSKVEMGLGRNWTIMKIRIYKHKNTNTEQEYKHRTKIQTQNKKRYNRKKHNKLKEQRNHLEACFVNPT